MYKKNKMIGFIHIPKCAGSSLNHSVFDALGQQPFHISKLVAPGSTDAPKSPHTAIIVPSLAFKIACNAPYLTGHIAFSDMKSMKRDFVFTVLRDPRKRLISVYTYAKKRANTERVVGRYPDLAKYASMGFAEYMEARQPENGIADSLLGDIAEFKTLYEALGRSAAPEEYAPIIESGLKRLDVVYSCPNQMILDDLHMRGLIPKAVEVVKNSSEGSVQFGELASREEFLSLLERATWLDMQVYRTAQRLFPETIRTPLASDEDIIVEVERRFAATFAE